jgi:valyl-tRNA synthetase
VHLTGLVRDASGQKMSKTKGNVVEPEALIEQHGADAMRFTLAILDSPGRDIPLDPERLAGYRAFGNKIWNATRFALARAGEARVRESFDLPELAVEERWILHALNETTAAVNSSLAEFRFDLACVHLYQFFWADFCDWYVELAKPALTPVDDDAKRIQVGDVLLTVLERALRLLHPVMPFLTEELWQRLPGTEAADTAHPKTICLAKYPGFQEGWQNEPAGRAVTLLRSLITAVRNDRVEKKVAPKSKVVLYLDRRPAELEGIGARRSDRHLLALAGVERVVVDTPPAGPWTGFVPLSEGQYKYAVRAAAGSDSASAPDVSALERHRAELSEIEQQIERAEAALAAPGFVAKAPAQVVEGRRRRLAELRERQRQLHDQLGVAASGS